MDALQEERQDALDYLADCYARSILELHQYEDRREQVLAARTVPEIRRVTESINSRDATRAMRPARSASAQEKTQSVLCIMGDRKLVPETVPDFVQSTCIMGDVGIDLRETAMSGVTRIHTVTIMGDTVIRVPENATVYNDITAIMADVKEKSGPRSPGGPEIHLTGVAIMADIKIKRG